MTDELERDRGSSAGAWAAAALVLALGALVFAVLAHVRISDLEDRVASLEAREPARGSTTGTAAPTSAPPGGASAPTPTAAAEPVDPEQARADVIAAFTAVYDPASGVDARTRLIDDATGVAAAIRQAAAGPNAAVVASAVVEVNDVQFTSPTRAKVVYAIAVPGQPPIMGREGEARVVAGAWKVTRATVCADLDAIGGSCG